MAAAHARPARRLGAALALVAVVIGWTVSPAGADHTGVGLGTARSFAILAGTGITNTGATTVTGDIGTFPTVSQTGFGSIVQTGVNHAGDAVTQGAKVDLVTAYNDAAGRLPETDLAGAELGGRVLPAGSYLDIGTGTLGLTGVLTLDGANDPHAMFVFKAASTLITGAGSSILLINGADPCRVVWQVGSSATFGVGTRFVGDVLAQTSISATAGATFRGRLLARDGAVTLINNTITAALCGGVPVAPIALPGLQIPTTTTAPATTTTTRPRTTTSTTDAPVAIVPISAPEVPVAIAAGPPLPPGFGQIVPLPPTTGPLPPGAVPPRPQLPVTGSTVAGLSVAGLALILIGAGALVADRRARRRLV